TLTYTIFGTFLSIFSGLLAALLVKEYFPGRNVFRGFLLFPYIAPVVAVAFVWKMMLNAQFGIVNELGVRWFGMQRTAFLAQRTLTTHLFGQEIRWPLALSMVILFETWRYFPFAFLFILARLQALPEELYEAAAVDGAVPSQRFWYITLPQLRGVFATLFLLRFIWTFNKFDDIYLLTGGGAGTKVLTVKVYEYLYGRYDIGAAAALAVVLGIVLAGFLVIYFRYMATEEA
ncbi:MAG TPA: sugar ABC transporter permease, partial [Anaerolineae bacterium]|nr:sugar ABC transporter permease [Anaerolineae bacterium]